MTSPKILAGAVACLAVAAHGGPRSTVLTLEDPPGDADGPGGYSPPSDSEMSADDFDLRRFVVEVEGEDVLLEVTLGASIRRPGVAQRTNSTPVELSNGLYYQNIDIYIDTDQTQGAGFSACIPGRRVTFAAGRTWERAVVFTPQPGRARAVVEAALPEAATSVLFPGPLVVQGRTLIARVPMAWLGGRPQPSWGWSVQVSGAAWERNFNLVKTAMGSAAADALTLPVETTADRYAFGGAPLGHVHPQIVDAIVPSGVEQHAVLSGYREDTGEFAQVPFVYAQAPAPSPLLAGEGSTSAAPPRLVVSDIMGELISVEGVAPDVRPMMIGSVMGPDGAVLARIVVIQVLDKGLVASALEHKEKITKGAAVRFPARPAGAATAP